MKKKLPTRALRQRIPDEIYLSIETFIDETFQLLEEQIGEFFILDMVVMNVSKEFRFMWNDAVFEKRKELAHSQVDVKARRDELEQLKEKTIFEKYGNSDRGK